MLKQIDKSGFSSLMERAHRAYLERELVTTQVALAKACTELIESRQKALHFRFQSKHDSLTSLPNSLSIHEFLETSLQASGPERARLAVMFIDIDKFKAINDQQGHLIGDQVLQIVSARISHAVRAGDRVGRLGGDEFLCLIENESSRGNIAKIANQICEAVREPIQIGLARIVVQASIGVAFSPTDAVDAEVLIGQADTAMYRAKRLKTGYALFDPEVDAHEGVPDNESSN